MSLKDHDPTESFPFDLVLERLGDRVTRRTGRSAMARCPAHDDRQPSLSVGVSDDGRVLLKCHAGCAFEAVLAGLGLEARDLFPRRPQEGNGRWAVESSWEYRDAEGNELYHKIRWRRPDGSKSYSYEQPDGTKSIRDLPRVPYRLPELLEARRGSLVFVVEGEKCCDAMRDIDLLATSNPNGAGKWRELDKRTRRDALQGMDVVILPDRDRLGREHAEDVARDLRSIARRLRVVELPGLAEKGDVADWIAERLAAGMEPVQIREELFELVDEAKGWAPEPEVELPPTTTTTEDVLEFLASQAPRDARESRASHTACEAQAPQESQESQESQDAQESRESQESQESQGAQAARKAEEHPKPRQSSRSDPNPDGLPQIFAGDGNLKGVTARAWDAIEGANDPPILFRHGGLPARIERGDDGSPLTREVTIDRMRYLLARVAYWFEIRKQKGVWYEVPAPPATMAVRDVLATPDPPLPVLERIVLAPIFAADGTLSLEPGYQPASRVYYFDSGLEIPQVPEEPSPKDVDRARELLLEDLLGDFPFLGPADRANTVALLLLPFVRNLVDGPTPLHLVEKPSPGTGASLLVGAVALPAVDRPPAALTEGNDEDEWRKRITSVLRLSPAFVLLDNLRRRVDSAALAAALTADIWTDRILGESEMAHIPVRCAWVATGNNPSVSTEMARRSVPIRLDAKRDRPWERSRFGFRHPSLLGWARKHRGELVWAALVFGRAWLAAGRPRETAVALGGFEAWSETLGGILGVAGVPAFLENLPTFYERADAETEVWRAFIAAWWERFGSEAQGVKELWELVGEGDIGLPLGRGSDRSQRIRLGMLLKQARDRRFSIVMEENGRAREAGDEPQEARDEPQEAGDEPQEAGDEPQEARARQTGDNGSGSLRTFTLRVTPAGTRQRAAQWRLVVLGECGESGECPFPPDVSERDGPLEKNGEKSAPSRAGGSIRIIHPHSPAGREEDVKENKGDKKDREDRKDRKDREEDPRDVEEWS